MMTSPPPKLPPARSLPYRVTFVCLGNICRSPMADIILREKVHQAGLSDSIEVTSCGTGDWHLGGPMDKRAAAQLRSMGFSPDEHRARQFTQEWGNRDLLLAMDHNNHKDILAILGESARPDQVRLFRDFDPEAEPGAEVPDPYYGGEDGFVAVATMVQRTCDNLLKQLRSTAQAEGSSVQG